MVRILVLVVGIETIEPHSYFLLDYLSDEGLVLFSHFFDFLVTFGEGYDGNILNQDCEIIFRHIFNLQMSVQGE